MAEAVVHAATTRESAASLESLRSNLGTEIGRQIYQSALSVVVGTGECSAAGVSTSKRAASLKIRPNTFLDAQDGMRRARHDISPLEALEEGVYVYNVRKTRSSPALTSLMRQFWHSDDLSRATGNSGDRDMYRESKARGAPGHPRRQINIQGGGDEVYRRFLQWSEYLAFKAEQGEGFADPGRNIFLATRCPCLVAPKVQQCACQIHTQQDLYLRALKLYMNGIHPDGCKCKCAWCAEGSGKWHNMCQNLATFFDSVACKKVNLFGGDPLGGIEFMGRKPDCVTNDLRGVWFWQGHSLVFGF